MAYHTMQRFIRVYGYDAWLTLLECADNGEKHGVIARKIPKSPRTGKKLSRRRISQLIEKLIHFRATPVEPAKLCLDRMIQSDQAGVDWAKEQILKLAEKADEADREALRYLPGRRTSRQSAEKA